VPASSRQVLLFLTLSHYSLLMEVQSLPENVPLALAFRFSLVHLQHRRGTRDEASKQKNGASAWDRKPLGNQAEFGVKESCSLSEKGRIGSAGAIYNSHATCRQRKLFLASGKPWTGRPVRALLYPARALRFPANTILRPSPESARQNPRPGA